MVVTVTFVVEYDDGQRNQMKIFTNLQEARVCADMWRSKVKKVTRTEEWQ